MTLKAACALIFCLLGMPLESFGQSPIVPGEHQAVLNGAKLWYKIAGRAQPGQAPVLFLHGGPGYNSYSFEKTIGTQLEDHEVMIYLDERGSGRSERPAGHDYKMSTLVADVEALREKLGVPQLSLMGHSFGGTIALEYAARFPEHVQKLIILDAASDLPKILALWRTQIEVRYPEVWKQALDGPLGQELKDAEATKDTCTIAKADFKAEMASLQKVNGQEFRNWQQFHEERYQQQQNELDNASGLRNTGELGSAYFGPDSQFPCYRFTAFQRLTMPVLVSVGRYDGAIGEQQMQDLAAHLPNARFDEFDSSAHFVYAEQPEKFVHDVTAFLKGAQ
jgi:proline iminopeptidase